jgi:hypothetical protein
MDNNDYEEELSSSEKIISEKRRRHQTYAAMDYLLSLGTYFDFFSKDTFRLVESASYLAKKVDRPIDTDLLFLSYFYCNSSVLELLSFSGFQQKIELNFATYFPELTALEVSLRSSKIKKFGRFLKKIFHLKPKIQPKELKKQEFSHDLFLIFEKASENALERFKTPVITSEILFITLMEANFTNTGKVIKNCFPNQTEWYLFRYELMKVIHKHESTIRSDIPKSQQYFAYLLRTQLSALEFNDLIETEGLENAVSLFRHSLILDTLETDILESLLKDIKMSIKITSKRTYSS